MIQFIAALALLGLLELLALVFRQPPAKPGQIDEAQRAAFYAALRSRPPD